MKMIAIKSLLAGFSLAGTLFGQSYSIMDLGPGTANDINNSGVVVGTSGDFGFVADGGDRRILTNLVYNSYSIGGSNLLEFGIRSTATVINDAGQVGGFVWNTTERYYDHLGKAYLLLGNTNYPTPLYSLFPQTPEIHAISENGSVMGRTAYVGEAAYGFSIGPRTFIDERFFPSDVNRPGTVAGTTITYTNTGAPFQGTLPQRMRAAILTNGSVVIIDPRPLPESRVESNVNSDDRNHWSDAYGINDSGVVVGAILVSVGGPRHAFRYRGSIFEDLGTLGGTNSVARKINSAGDIVGESLTAGGKTHAFIHQGGLMRDLNSLLPPGSGMELISANAINDRGEIVGEAIFEGQSRAYLLSPSGLVNPPRVVAQPEGGRLALGENLALSVSASGTLPFTYQWTFNGTNILNATNATYTISSATAANAGEYRVLVTNEGGTTPSITVRVDVLDPRLVAVNLMALEITGVVGGTYRIELRPSANASTWTTVTNVTLTTSPQLWIDVDSRNHPSRIYRAIPLP